MTSQKITPIKRVGVTEKRALAQKFSIMPVAPYPKKLTIPYSARPEKITSKPSLAGGKGDFLFGDWLITSRF
jgi:hypothetical protein